MRHYLVALAAVVALAVAPSGGAHSGSSHSHSSSSHSSGTHNSGHSAAPHISPHASSAHSGTYHSGGQQAAVGVKRDAHGKVARDPHAKEAFRKLHPCPATGKTYGACPGWVVDHRQALKHGGADDPSNMQWQTQTAAKAKDKWE